MIRIRLALLAILFLGLTTEVLARDYAAEGWKLSKKNDSKGIYIYQRHEPGYNINSFLATATVDATIPQLLTLVTDEEIALSFMYKLKAFRILEEISDEEVMQYMRIEAPYPVKDRDIVLRVKTSKEPGKVILNARPEPEYYPEQEGVVRMSEYYIDYYLTPLEGGRTYIEMQGMGDPGGNIPVWVINFTLDNVPYISLKRLMRTVTKYPDIDTSKYDMWDIAPVEVDGSGQMVEKKPTKEWPIFKGWQKRWQEWARNRKKEKKESTSKVQVKVL